MKLNEMIESANINMNKRSHYLLHHSKDDDIQTIAFCIQPKTLIDVHKHKKGTETIICLKGEMAVTFLKNEQLEVIVLNENNPVLTFNPNFWHTYTSLKKDTVGIEIKEGPYNKDDFIRHKGLNNENKRLNLNKMIMKEIEIV